MWKPSKFCRFTTSTTWLKRSLWSTANSETGWCRTQPTTPRWLSISGRHLTSETMRKSLKLLSKRRPSRLAWSNCRCLCWRNWWMKLMLDWGKKWGPCWKGEVWSWRIRIGGGPAWRIARCAVRQNQRATTNRANTNADNYFIQCHSLW